MQAAAFDLGADPRVCPVGQAQAPETRAGQARGPAPRLSVTDLVQRFKSLPTTRYRQGVALQGRPRLPGQLWQRNYYEHIIRDRGLDVIREYIATNPARWETDGENILSNAARTKTIR